ncbi:MAG: bifunctional heptose 7-phosphate kinase/heptose 1-phosphate adenyltransferase [Christensenellales bacterium]
MLDRARLQALLERLPGLRVAVLGDLFLDRWLFVDPSLDEPSLETGLPAWQVVQDKRAPGAAGTVLNNLSALGVGSILALSLLGEDGAGRDVEMALRERRVDTRFIIRSNQIVTPQYIKPMRLMAAGPAVEMNRIDVKNLAATPAELEERLMENLTLAAGESDAVILLDQLTEADRGVLTGRVRQHAMQLAGGRQDLLFFADSRAFIHLYRDVIVKCNDLEAARMAGRAQGDAFDREEVFQDLKTLMAQTGKMAFVTCNRHGIAAKDADGCLLAPAVRHKGPIDVCGAGDATTASIVSALCAGATPGEAAAIGNLAAGVTVRKIGDTGTASPLEILRLYDEQRAEETP